MHATTKERGVTWYLRDIKPYPQLSEQEANTLAQRLPEMREQLIVGHLRQVVQIAYAYQDQGVPLADLIQEGNLCLVQAVDAYVQDSGTSFCASLQGKFREVMEQTICTGSGSHGACIALASLPEYGGRRGGRATLGLGNASTSRTPLDDLLVEDAYAQVVTGLEQLGADQKTALAVQYGFVERAEEAASPAHVQAGLAHLRTLRAALLLLL